MTERNIEEIHRLTKERPSIPASEFYQKNKDKDLFNVDNEDMINN